MKKILFMGGNILQAAAIRRAKELGYYTICVDMAGGCPGKNCADEFFNISTTDIPAVLALAEEKRIDGVLSYASDVSAYTAAVVCESLGLPTNPAESVNILTHKNLFREFLRKNGYSTPGFQAFEKKQEAEEYFILARLPLIIKPVDSAGSKGVRKLKDRTDFSEAFDCAKSFSRNGKIILEEYITRNGYQIDGEGFIKDGKIVFFAAMDQHHNDEKNPYVPIGSSYPSVWRQELQVKAKEILQDIFDRLNMKFGAFNSEFIVDAENKIHIIEIGPRNGGNYIPNTLQYACGVDMMTASIKACVAESYGDCLQVKYMKPTTYYMLHSLKSGHFSHISYTKGLKERTVQQELLVKPGDYVHAFRGGADGIGLVVIEFEDVETMNRYMDRMWEYVVVHVNN